MKFFTSSANLDEFRLKTFSFLALFEARSIRKVSWECWSLYIFWVQLTATRWNEIAQGAEPWEIAFKFLSSEGTKSTEFRPFQGLENIYGWMFPGLRSMTRSALRFLIWAPLGPGFPGEWLLEILAVFGQRELLRKGWDERRCRAKNLF